MRTSWRYIRWVTKPQFVVGFIVLCLCSNAMGNLVRASYPSSSHHASSHGAVNGIRGTAPLNPDCRAKPCIALTFDDGPEVSTTPQILDILARQQIHATFFVIGQRVAGREAIVHRAFQQGNEIGNHSWSHPDLSTLPPEQVEEQLQRTQQAIAGAGVPAPRLLRPPYGAVDDMVAAHNNLTVIRWNVDPEDWKERDPAKIDQSLYEHVHPGAIILMHDIYPSTVAALEPAITTLKQTYQFVTISQLYNLSPGDQGQYFGHRK